jgi:hypothetical protein
MAQPASHSIPADIVCDRAQIAAMVRAAQRYRVHIDLVDASAEQVSQGVERLAGEPSTMRDGDRHDHARI